MYFRTREKIIYVYMNIHIQYKKKIFWNRNTPWMAKFPLQVTPITFSLTNRHNSHPVRFLTKEQSLCYCNSFSNFQFDFQGRSRIFRTDLSTVNSSHSKGAKTSFIRVRVENSVKHHRWKDAILSIFGWNPWNSSFKINFKIAAKNLFKIKSR